MDAGVVEIAAHLVYEMDADGRKLLVKKLTDYTGEKVRSMYPWAAELRAKWSNAAERAATRQGERWPVRPFRVRTATRHPVTIESTSTVNRKCRFPKYPPGPGSAVRNQRGLSRYAVRRRSKSRTAALVSSRGPVSGMAVSAVVNELASERSGC